ncbi:MAG: hypothetical protein WCD89_02480 [Anaerocolumna sp.]
MYWRGVIICQEADYYLYSHESVCTRDEIVDYWDKLRRGAEIAGTSGNFEFKKEPSEDDIFFIKSFVLGKDGKEQDTQVRYGGI